MAKPPKADPAAAWPGAREAVAWYAANRDRVPAAPFALPPGCEVEDREKFLESLDRDVAAGPDSPRAAGVVSELEALRDLVEPG